MTVNSPEVVPVPVLSYAMPRGKADPLRRRAAVLQLALAVMSGPCVAACIAALTWGTLGTVLHVAVYTVTAVLGWRAWVSMSAATRLTPARQWLEGMAAVGLLMIGVAPLLWTADGFRGAGCLWVGSAFGLLCASSYRHRMLYDMLGDWVRQAGGRPGGLRALGVVKLAYEGVWLACCALFLWGIGLDQKGDWIIAPAYAALFGLLGFGLVWIWMVTAGSVLLGRLAGPRA